MWKSGVSCLGTCPTREVGGGSSWASRDLAFCSGVLGRRDPWLHHISCEKKCQAPEVPEGISRAH